MITADQLQEGLNKLREAVEAWAFALSFVVIQKGHIVLPDDEVTGEYLAALLVGLTLHERERAAVRLDEQFTVRRETNAVVLIPLSNDHSGKLATYELRRHDGHTHVEFTLAVRPFGPNTL